MTHNQLKQLEDKLHDFVNAMRTHSGLKVSKYAV